MPEISGTKWGSDRLRTDGGVVTYSIVGGDVAGFFGENEERSADPDTFADFNIRALFRQAFNAWTDVANIEFVEVKEQGEAFAYGYAADIRVVFAPIDGRGDFLGFARLPLAVPLPTEGDITIDSDEPSLSRDRQKLLAVATHEIGHSIGLEHVEIDGVLMNPNYQPGVISPQADDILGARQVYGQQDGRHAPLRMTDRAPDIELAAPVDGLRIIGTNDANRISGARSDEQLLGRAGDDVLLGRGGDDLLVGGGGADIARGGGGEDTIRGGIGADTIIGGGRGDLLNGGGGADSLRGGGGDDTILGRGGADLIDGGGGDDELTGGAGADRFRASAGEDVITDFSTRVDVLDYSRNGAVTSIADLTLTDSANGLTIDDPTGARFILTGVTASEFSEANLVFTPFEAPQSAVPAGRMIEGGSLNDALIGTAGPDTLLGGGGDDTLFGYAGDDHLDGQALSTNFNELFDQNLLVRGSLQQLFGGAGDDTLENGLEFYGGDGDDMLITSGSFDLSVSGGRGDDVFVVVGVEHELIGGEGADEFRFLTEDETRDINILDFEPGVDRLFFAAGKGVDSRQDVSLRNTNDGLLIDFGTGGFATLRGINRNEFSFDDVIFEAQTLPLPEEEEGEPIDGLDPSFFEDMLIVGDDGDDRLFGFEGDDTIDGAGGEDNLNGNGGDDRLFGGSGPDNLSGAGGNDTLDGGDGDDRLDAQSGDDLLFGGAGDDILSGGNDDDTIFGGPGDDTIDTGDGADVVVIEASPGPEADNLLFFDHTVDVIDFSQNADVNGLADLTLTDVEFEAVISFGEDSVQFTVLGPRLTLEDITFLF